MDKTAFATHTAAIETDKRIAAAGLLQGLVVDLTDLSLQGKQAHWNVRGTTFRDLHLQLDELVESAGRHADTLAERCLALGVAADGRLQTIARNTHLDPFPEGRVEDHIVVTLVVNRLETVSESARKQLGRLGELDPASQDLVLEALEDIEKQLWMFDAHRPMERTRG